MAEVHHQDDCTKSRHSQFLIVLALNVLVLPCAASAQIGGLTTSAGMVAEPKPPADSLLAAPVPPAPPGELKFVVAVFRHGVRAPLANFAATANQYSKQPWPLMSDWGVSAWGDLTPHGFQAVRSLGAYYGDYYRRSAWPSGFRAYLWADVDERTRETGRALKEGMQRPGVDVKLEFSSQAVDPLFHPFKAMCGTPGKNELQKIADRINGNLNNWRSGLDGSFGELYGVLGKNNPPKCSNSDKCTQCACVSSSGPSESRQSSPIGWSGEFSYASSATEAFLLEYGNDMSPQQVGWGNLHVQPNDPGADLQKLLGLHEFYFDKTQRPEYLAKISGSNLVREISDQLNRKAGIRSPLEGKCARGEADRQFVGLVGHDTNLANIGTLLHLSWKFDDPQFPGDLRQIPADDALPAGALVFELRQRGQDYWVHIDYLTQTPTEMRNANGEPVRVQTICTEGNANVISKCDMPLNMFNQRIKQALGDDNGFLSKCEKGQQVCP